MTRCRVAAVVTVRAAVTGRSGFLAARVVRQLVAGAGGRGSHGRRRAAWRRGRFVHAVVGDLVAGWTDGAAGTSTWSTTWPAWPAPPRRTSTSVCASSRRPARGAGVVPGPAASAGARVTSSLAVFGSDPAIGPVGVVDDDTLPRPQSSYGIRKFVGEQLIADYTRKGVRTRARRAPDDGVGAPGPVQRTGVRLPIGYRSRAAGRRAGQVPRATRHRGRAVLAAQDRGSDPAAGAVDDARWVSTTALTLPALTTTPGQMAGPSTGCQDAG